MCKFKQGDFMSSILNSHLLAVRNQKHFQKHFEKISLALWFTQLVLSFLVALS